MARWLNNAIEDALASQPYPILQVLVSPFERKLDAIDDSEENQDFR